MVGNLLLRSGRAEAQVLVSEVDSLREFPEGRRLLLLDSDVIIGHCREYPGKVRGYWQSFLKTSEGRPFVVEDVAPFFVQIISFAETCQETIASVRRGLEEAEKGRQDLEEEPGEPIPSPDLSALDVAAEDLQALRSEVVGRWDWLRTAPARKRSLRTTAEIRAGRARGEYVSVGEVIAELGGNPSEGA